MLLGINLVSIAHLFKEHQCDQHLKGQELDQRFVFGHMGGELAVKPNNSPDGQHCGDNLQDIQLKDALDLVKRIDPECLTHIYAKWVSRLSRQYVPCA